MATEGPGRGHEGPERALERLDDVGIAGAGGEAQLGLLDAVGAVVLPERQRAKHQQRREEEDVVRLRVDVAAKGGGERREAE